MTAIFVSRIRPLNSNNPRRCRLVLVLLCSIVLVLQLPSSAQARYAAIPVADSSDTPGDPPIAEIEFVDYVGGAVTALAIRGDHAFLGVSTELVIVDISDPSLPSPVGHLLLADRITNILVDNTDFIYVITESYLQVIDVSQPEYPIQKGSLALQDRGYRDATIFASHMYLLSFRLTVVDISDTDHPLLTTELSLDTSHESMTIDRGYLFGVATTWFSSGEIRVWDLTNPDIPQEVYYKYDWDWPDFRNIVIAGQYAYVGDGGETVVMDISDPTDPRQIARWSFGFKVVIDQYAYTGRQIWDISDPTMPVEVRSYLPEPLYYHGYNDPNIVVASDSIYLLYGNSLHILDVTDRVSPKLSGNYQLQLIDLQKVSVLGDRIVYPGSPLRKYDDAMSVISGDYLYRVYQFCSKWCSPITLEILDVSNLYQPWPVLSTLTLPVLPEYITVQQDHLFLLGRPYAQPFQMQIVDVSDPRDPTLLGVYTDATLSFFRPFLTVSKNYVFITSGADEDIRVVDISTPSEPQMAALIQIPSVLGLAIVQDHLFVLHSISDDLGNSYGELAVYEVSDSTHPILRQTIRLHQPGTWLTSIEHYLYIATYGGLYVFDASMPTALKVSASYLGFNYPTGLIFNKDYIFLPAISMSGNFSNNGIQEEFGLLVLWFSPPVRKAFGTGNPETLAVPNGPEYVFPANTFSQPVTVTHQARYPKNIPSVGTLTATDLVFKVQAHDETGQLAQPQLSYSLKVSYTPQQVASLIPETLSIYFWDGNMWQREANSYVDSEKQVIVAQPNRMGLWAVYN